MMLPVLVPTDLASPIALLTHVGFAGVFDETPLQTWRSLELSHRGVDRLLRTSTVTSRIVAEARIPSNARLLLLLRLAVPQHLAARLVMVGLLEKNGHSLSRTVQSSPCLDEAINALVPNSSQPCYIRRSAAIFEANRRIARPYDVPLSRDLTVLDLRAFTTLVTHCWRLDGQSALIIGILWQATTNHTLVPAVLNLLGHVFLMAELNIVENLLIHYQGAIEPHLSRDIGPQLMVCCMTIMLTETRPDGSRSNPDQARLAESVLERLHLHGGRCAGHPECHCEIVF
jgi:hypothetical protein